MSESVDPREPLPAAQIETRFRQPDLCTIYETDDEGKSKRETWITAKEESFSSLESMR